MSRLQFPSTSLRVGLLLTYLVLIATSLSLLAWRIGSSLDASRFSETKRDQEGRAILAASVAGEWWANYRDVTIDRDALRQATETLSRQISQPVTILDSNGIVLVDAEFPDQVDQDDSRDPEITAAWTGRVSSTVRFDPDDDGDALFTVAPVRYGGELVGFVRLELPMRLVTETSQRLWFRVIGATLLAGLVTSIVSLLLARAITQPIERIGRAATALAHGDLDQRLAISNPTELGQLARSFNFMAERITQVMQDQHDFVANAAHELRTPLTTIRLRAEALHEGAKDDPTVAKQFLGDIVNESERLSRLVDQLLDLSRIETGLATARREPALLERIARAVVAKNEWDATIQIVAEKNLPSVEVDPDQMRQVFINLIDNASKFGAPGSKIEITIARHDASRALGNLPARRWLVTTIRDFGIGIPAEDLAHVFERFYRSDKARARETGGAGLGLAIVKGIIDAHAGRVWVESEQGKGTRFSFALPIP